LFSKKGLVSLKFFLVFSLLILVFTISLTSALKKMVLSSEIDELHRFAIDAEKNGGGKLINCSTHYLPPENNLTNRGEYFIEESVDGRDFLILYRDGIVIERDITNKNSILNQITVLIFLFSFGLLLLTFIYSKILEIDTRKPILLLNRYLENISEKALNKIPKDKLPEDFHLLADTINDLINRIDVFIGTQKELFIGASHELKTPLAVVKLKNQVLLMKEREPEEYIEAIKFVNDKIDEMNRVVSDVLNIGRQESAQFESPVERDIISFLKEKSYDFSILAQAQGKSLVTDLKPNQFIASIQETLLNQIIQNFLQNALKFTPKGKKIELKSYLNENNHLTIEVIDEGIGVDEKQDIFAPFNRKGNKSGVGLGLFIAKSGADAMGAKISVKNRKDGVDGAVASLELRTKPLCII